MFVCVVCIVCVCFVCVFVFVRGVCLFVYSRLWFGIVCFLFLMCVVSVGVDGVVGVFGVVGV